MQNLQVQTNVRTATFYMIIIMIQIIWKMVESATWVFWFVSSIIFHSSPSTIFGTQAQKFPLHMAKNQTPWRILLWLVTQRIELWEKILKKKSEVCEWLDVEQSRGRNRDRREQKRYKITKKKWMWAKIKRSCTLFESLNLDRWIKFDSLLCAILIDRSNRLVRLWCPHVQLRMLIIYGIIIFFNILSL